MSEDKEFNELIYGILNPVNDVEKGSEGIALKVLFERRLRELDLSQNQVEKLLNIERKSLMGILDRTAKRVDVLNIMKLGNFLNLRPDEFLKFYLPEMPSDAIGELEKVKKLNYIVSNFDLANLRKSNFITSKSDYENIEKRITKYFGLSQIFDYSSKFISTAFSRTKRSYSNKMREFWIQSAYGHFKGINNPNEFSRELLVDLLPKIRPYSMNVEKGLLTVTRALYNAGVTVIYQPTLPTVQVRGATFCINKKPCIVITTLNNNYPTLWFALIHELHHCLYDLEEIEKYTYHITGEPDLLLMSEDKANAFAREYWFSEERSKYIAPLINDEILVRDYAKQSQVHPSFVYNFYNYDMHIKGDNLAWSRFKQFFPDVKLSIRFLNTNPWEKETIEESVKVIKETIFNII